MNTAPTKTQHPQEQNQKNQRAFTLIELLVVIAIIGVLATIVLASLSSARDKAKNSHKVQTILQYRTALQSYQISNGTYPNENEATNPICLGENYPSSICVLDGIELSSTSAADNPNIALESEISGHPTPKDTMPDGLSGISYECADAACSDYYLYWYIDSNTCNLGTVDGSTSGYTRCRISSEE